MIDLNHMQDYWFPGYASQRSIFDFTNGVLNIESPGIPLVPEDSNNFGNVITLNNDVGYYIIGKYLMDSAYNVVSGSGGIFDKAPANIACCAFAPDVNNNNAAHLYFIDAEGLHYGNIKRSMINESSIDSLNLIALSLPPMQNSPLSIMGDRYADGNWLFYISQQDDTQRLVVAYCSAAQEITTTHVLLPSAGMPISIDVCKNRIAVVFDDASLLYGTLTVSNKMMSVAIDDSINGLSHECVQSAFSASATSLFWLTKESKVGYINFRNMLTGAVTRQATVGIYKALKRGPDNAIYGLCHRTKGSSTLLIITPTGPEEEYSVSEIFASANGGYFPATGWSVYS